MRRATQAQISCLFRGALSQRLRLNSSRVMWSGQVVDSTSSASARLGKPSRMTVFRPAHPLARMECMGDAWLHGWGSVSSRPAAEEAGEKVPAVEGDWSCRGLRSPMWLLLGCTMFACCCTPHM